MTHDSLLATSSVLQTCHAQHAEVLSVRQEVTWADGSTIALHPVLQHGSHATLLRAVHHNGQWLLIDLAHVIPRDVVDIKAAHYRDQVGLVMYALRRCYHNAPALLARIDRQHLAQWPGSPRPAEPRPIRSALRPVNALEA